MNKTELPDISYQTGGPEKDNRFDPLLILNLILRNWYFFVAAIIVALLGARFYINHTLPVFKVTASVLIFEDDSRMTMNNEELLQGLGLPGGIRNMDNQIKIITSRSLTEKTLQELSFEIEYYLKTLRNRLPVYPDIPVRIVSDNVNPLPKDTEFSISYLGNNMFSIQSESDYFTLNKTASFGETIEMPGGSFRIELRDEGWFQTNIGHNLYFVIYSHLRLIDYYNGRLSVDLASREGSILNISISGTNRRKDADFLNKHVEVFQSLSLDRKDAEALRRIQFIDDQLVGISDSLSVTENRLQQFRSSHRIMDLSAQGQAIIGQINVLETEKARLELEANYYDYLADYLAKEVSREVPIVPITMGINDPGLTRLVEELAQLQQQLLNRGAGEMNPIQNLLEQRVRSTKEALVETLNGLRRANSLARSENEQSINRVNRQASALPATERQLLGIERKFNLNNELYNFLLETRANLQMQKASNSADSEVIDPADVNYAELVAPSPVKIYFAGLLAGAGIPFIIIFLFYILNKKLSEDDIRRHTILPVVGNIPRNQEKTGTVVLDYPNSSLAESFRLLRSRMQFFTKQVESPVILVTSSMPEEGKTFMAINLASVYSLLGKRTLLVGFDLRKPKIYQDFNLSNEKGISTWLIGKDKLEDIVQETGFENLSVIAAGPVPPNPSELTALDRTDELFKLLREKYDYIILDSSPIGLVSDTYHLATFADSCLLVVRPGKILRDMFDRTLKEIENSRIKGISIVINDIQSDSKHYNMGEKYGYADGKERSKRRFSLKRIFKPNI